MALRGRLLPASGSPARAGAGSPSARASRGRRWSGAGLASSLSREGWASWRRRQAAPGLLRAASRSGRPSEIESSRKEPAAADSLNFRPLILPPPEPQLRLLCSHSLRTGSHTTVVAAGRWPAEATRHGGRLDTDGHSGPMATDRQKVTLTTDSTLASDSPARAHAPIVDRIGNFSRLSLARVRQVASRPVRAVARNEEAGSGVSGAGLVEVSRRSSGKNLEPELQATVGCERRAWCDRARICEEARAGRGIGARPRCWPPRG